MNKNKKMSYWGVGPVYVTLSLIITIIGWVFGGKPALCIGVNYKIKFIMYGLGTVLILYGIYLWINAVVISKIDKNIDKNNLVTTGMYAWVRNPIYTAFAMIFSGIILFRNNLFLIVIPFILWGLMSIIVRKEEKVLENIFGAEYLEYKMKVNRCIPWIPNSTNKMHSKIKSIRNYPESNLIIKLINSIKRYL